MIAFITFETAVGFCGIAWNRNGDVVGVQLPEATDAATRRRLLRRHPDGRSASPPPAVQDVIEAVVALLAGEHRDLSAVALDMSDVPDFRRRVYEVARRIPPGSTSTYGAIATELGDRLLARDVGDALGHNRFPIVVPCHRVVAADGRLGGFSANGGAATKRKLLLIERATSVPPSLFD
ncbi:MAG: methylated-DNA-[protein]-cysteine S-methyltransferase [Acidimicrobiaceae bacterium]|nr:methylated-DNA-[protein]-cysteine S-methyltransferase [Acidimicrobiaceae bacterium]